MIVATPDHWHARIAIEAMQAGKDVYCQKPMVQRVAEGRDVVAAQEKTGRILQVGSQRVSSVLYAKARDLIRQGAIGEVHMVESFWDRNSPIGAWQYSIPPDATPENIDWERFLGRAPRRPFEPLRLFRWRNYQDYGTGVCGDLFVHQFSGIHFIMDSLGPERVYATGGLHFWKDGRDVPDVMMGSYDYARTSRHPAFQVSLRVNFVAGGGDAHGFRFVGSEGVLNLSVGGSLILSKRPKRAEPGHTAGTFAKAMRDQYLSEYRGKYPPREPSAAALEPAAEERFSLPSGYTEQYAHHEAFFASVRSRKPVTEDAAFGLRAAGPALLSNVSHFEGRICRWDPEQMIEKAG